MEASHDVTHTCARRTNTVEYVKISDEGIHIKVHGKKGEEPSEQVLDVDNVVVCAGQNSVSGLIEPLQKADVPVFAIGGAEHAGELDAKRAIDQGTRLAAVIETAKSGEVWVLGSGWPSSDMSVWSPHCPTPSWLLTQVFNHPIPWGADLVRTARKLTGRSHS